MKAVFISYNQSLTEMVQLTLDNLAIKGYTQWTDIQGCGTDEGVPHEGSHRWPELNNAHLTIIEDEKVTRLLERLNALNTEVEKQGLRAFVWNIENTI